MHFHLYRSLLLLAVLCIAVGARASDPWHGAYNNGTALWHCDQADTATPNAVKDGTPAALAGTVALDTQEKYYGNGALHFTGGALTVNPFNWSSYNRSLEAFVKVGAYPAAGKEACLFAFVDGQGKTMHALTLTAGGGVKFSFFSRDNSMEQYGATLTITLPDGTLPVGRWMHIGLHSLGYYNMTRVTVDGKIVGEEGGVIVDGKFTLLAGNSADGTQPFNGWLDELRQAEETDMTARPSLRNAVKPRPTADLPDDAKFFPNNKNLLLYCPFDGTLDPAVAGGAKSFHWRVNELQPRYTDGLHGKALVLGCPLDYPALGNINPAAGTFSCWMQVDKGAAFGRLFKLGEGWNFMLSDSHGLYVEGGSRGRFITHGGFFNGLTPQQWHQVALAWQGEWVYCYFDGRPNGTFLLPGGLKPYLPNNTTVSMGDSWMKYGAENAPVAALDEFRIYSKALSPEEVQNLYRIEVGQPLLPVTARATSFFPYPGKRTIVAEISQDLPGITAGANLTMTLTDAAGKQIAQTAATRMVLGNAEMSLRFPEMPKGDYTVRVRQTVKTEVVLDDTIVYHHEDYPWLRAHTGAVDKVLPPWTPVVAGANTIGVWNREITLDGAALPTGISVGGKKLLAGPAYFEVEKSDGTVAKLAVDGAALQKIVATPTRATYHGAIHTEQFDMAVVNQTEYDGCAKLTLQLKPSAKPAEIRRLTLVFPLEQRAAQFINAKGSAIREKYLIGALPQQNGRVFGSHILPWCGVKSDPLKLLADYDAYRQLARGGKDIPKELQPFGYIGWRPERMHETTTGSFLPYLWVGNPDMGLCWFADTDQGWVRGDSATPAVEIRQVNAAQCTELRINFIAAPTTITAPRNIVFGLQATPVKPLEPGWRKDYWYRDAKILGFGFEFQSGRYSLGRGCPGAYGGEPFAWDVPRAKAFSQFAKKKGFLQVPYMEFTNTYADLTADVQREWRQQPQAWSVQGGMRPTESYADWFCYNFNQYIHEVGIDGVYFDNVCPLPSLNETAHGAWRDADGQPQASFDTWELRDFLRRVRTIFLDNGVAHPWIQLHMTHGNLIPAMAYADILFDGEDFYLNANDKDDFMDRWPLEMITAIDSADAWGVPTLFLPHTQGGGWEDKPGGIIPTLRTGVGEQLLVDLNGGFWQFNGAGALSNFGVDKPDTRFIGYWRNTFTCADPEIKVSAYQRTDRLLLVITNFSHQEKTVDVTFSPQGLLTFAATEGEVVDGERPAHDNLRGALKQNGNTWTITAGPIPGRDFRLVEIRRKGQ